MKIRLNRWDHFAAKKVIQLMSHNEDNLIWVGDLNGYIDIDAISAENEREERDLWESVLWTQKEADLEGLGNIVLFAEKSISSLRLYEKGVEPEQWRWALHHAQTSLGQSQSCAEVEAAFLKTTMSWARRYAVARYARFEGVAFSSATTAMFPHGIRALLFSYMAGEPALSDQSCRMEIQRSLRVATSTPDLIPYDKVALVRRCIHQLAIDSAGRNGHLQLDKNRMRNLLSLLRLHFSNLESQVQSAKELRSIYSRYSSARKAERFGPETKKILTGKKIQNWRMRSLHPLTFYFPFSARNSLDRLISHVASDTIKVTRTLAANELALTYCGIELMRGSNRWRVADRA